MAESSPSLLTCLGNTIAMLIASVLKNLLWTLRYPSFASETGPYRVGAIQTRIPGTINCQIHYPTNDDDKSQNPSFYPYFRPKAVEGLSDYSGTSADLLEFLSNRNHPCLMNANPLDDDNNNNKDPSSTSTKKKKKFPLVIFSHGLGGCMEMYTQLCQQIASYGYCVVAMEHEDGSGAYAETKNGDAILYKRPDDTPYSRQKVINFRRPFLKQRVEETTNVLQYILEQSKSINTSTTSNISGFNDKLQQVLQCVDTSKGVALVGHSFGGATMILAAQKYLSMQQQQQIDDNETTVTIQPASLSLLDPWAFSLEDDALNKGIMDGIPTLTVLSEKWVTNPETAQIDQFLRNCPTLVTTSLYAPNSVHASVADSVSWLPGFILRKTGLRGAKEKKFVTIEAVAKVCVQQIKNGKVDDMSSLREYKFEKAKNVEQQQQQQQQQQQTASVVA